MTCSSIDRLAGRSIFFKAEVFQKVGAFKARGATNAVQSLSDDDSAKGVVAHSSGNHAQALAWAAGLRGIPSYLIVPTTTPKCKVDAIRGYNPQGLTTHGVQTPVLTNVLTTMSITRHYATQAR